MTVNVIQRFLYNVGVSVRYLLYHWPHCWNICCCRWGRPPSSGYCWYTSAIWSTITTIDLHRICHQQAPIQICFDRRTPIHKWYNCLRCPLWNHRHLHLHHHHHHQITMYQLVIIWIISYHQSNKTENSKWKIENNKTENNKTESNN